MRRNNHFFSGFSGFCLLAAICWYGKGFYQEWKADSLPVVEVTAAQLADNMEQNEPGTQASLEGKRIAVTGMIDSFDETFGKGQVRLTGTPGEFGGCDVVVGLADKADAMKMHKGDVVTLVGVDPSVTMCDVFLDAGKVYKQEKKEEPAPAEPAPTPEPATKPAQAAGQTATINVDCQLIGRSVLRARGIATDAYNIDTVVNACSSGAKWAAKNYTANEIRHYSPNEVQEAAFKAGAHYVLDQYAAQLAAAK